MKTATVAIILVPSVAVLSARAAPPAVTSLFPAGAQRGMTAEVTAAGTFEHWPVQAWASGRGVEVKAGTDKGKLSISVARDAVPGTYWLRLFDEQGASAPRPFLVGTLPEVRDREPNDDPKAPQRLDGPCVVNGKLDKAGDVDGFAVECRRGQTLVAALEANATLRSPMDAVLQVVSPAGFVLAQDHDAHGLDPFLAFPVPKDGTYVVRAFAFPATPDASVRFAGGDAFIYRLTVTTGGYGDYTWPLAVSRARPGKVEIVGWNLPASLSRKRLKAAPEDESTLIDPAVANPLRVRVEPHPCAVKPPGAEPFSLTIPMTVSSRLDRPGAADVYTFAATKGQSIAFRVEALALGLPLVSTLRLTDADGKEVAKAEPPGLSKDPDLTFTPTQELTYRLTVRDAFDHGGPRYAYRLRATRPEPDFALALKADRFTVEAGKTLDVPVTVTRLGGFAGDVEVSAEGLPPAVEVVPPDPAAKAAPVLRLSAKAEARGSGPIRVVGRPRVWPPNFTRTAAAPLADFGVTTADLWLTVTKPAETKPAEVDKKPQ
jgi:hypothetical protein